MTDRLVNEPLTEWPVEYRDVRFAYPAPRRRPSAGDGRRVLDGVSLALQGGSVLALVGRSGSGKTTLLRFANRLLMPDAGAVLVEGRDTREWDPIRLRRRIGYVMQEAGLLPHFTVADNVGLVPRLEGWDAARIRARVHELLALVGLEPSSFAERWPHELSGGQRQRVGVARALAADPPILLMDEPFGALDVVTRAELRREFRRILREVHKTVLFVTHDIGEAFTLGDRVGVLSDGVLAACGPPSAIARSTDDRVRPFVDALSAPPA
jgi:osmoprotectant transport system ATP-binding protein